MPTDSAANHEANDHFEIHSLEVEIDIDLFDSEYLKRFAQAQWPDSLDVLLQYLDNRFKLLARHLISRLAGR
jgi:hypothetical protein